MDLHRPYVREIKEEKTALRPDRLGPGPWICLSPLSRSSPQDTCSSAGPGRCVHPSLKQIILRLDQKLKKNSLVNSAYVAQKISLLLTECFLHLSFLTERKGCRAFDCAE